MSKSEAIRTYKAEHPEAGPTEIAAALTAQGIEVTPALVSVVLANAKRRAAGGAAVQKRRRKPITRIARDSEGRGNGVHPVLIAKQYVDAVGGLASAQSLLEVLSKLIGGGEARKMK